MPEIRHKYKRYEIAFYILLSGFTVLGFNLIEKHQRYFIDEPASEITVRIQERPKYISGGKGGTSRYQFFTYEYQIAFWLSDGALDIINDSRKVKKLIESLNIGDTLIVVVRDTDLHFLKNDAGKIRVMGLECKGIQLVSAADVRIKDQGNLNFNLLIGGLLICLGSIVLTYQITYRSRYKEVAEIENSSDLM